MIVTKNGDSVCHNFLVEWKQDSQGVNETLLAGERYAYSIDQ